MNNTKKQVNNVWDNYWRSGAEASFLNKNTSLQRYQMRKFWFERMSEFEAKSPIVDIGCGNGILIGWLNEYKNEKNKSKWQLIGVDSAALRPTNPELDVRERHGAAVGDGDVGAGDEVDAVHNRSARRRARRHLAHVEAVDGDGVGAGDVRGATREVEAVDLHRAARRRGDVLHDVET